MQERVDWDRDVPSVPVAEAFEEFVGSIHVALRAQDFGYSDAAGSLEDH